MITEQEKKSILEGDELVISSSRSTAQQIILVMLFVFFAFIFFKMTPKAGDIWKTSDYISLAIGIVVLSFVGLMISRLATVKLKGNKILVRRLFQKEEIIMLTEIEDINDFRITTSTYLSLLIRKDGKQKRIWVLKPSILNQGSDVYEILHEAWYWYKM